MIDIAATLRLRYTGFTKIPMLLFVRPRVVEADAERVVVKIPLRRRTRNHLRSMYFGALSVGADCAGGLIAWEAIQRSGADVSLIFKDFNARFLRRAEGDVLFTCDQGRAIRELVDRALASDERVEMPVPVTATLADGPEQGPVAEFILTLSLKRRGSHSG